MEKHPRIATAQKFVTIKYLKKKNHDNILFNKANIYSKYVTLTGKYWQ